jgi:hypothetical protein
MSRHLGILNLWKKRAFVAQKAHYGTAVKLDKRNHVIGILGVTFNTIVGSVVFATLITEANIAWIKIGAGVISLIAAVLVGIQTFRRDGEKAEKHRVCAAKFSVMQRELEFIEARDADGEELDRLLSKFNDQYNNLISEAPVADGNIYEHLYNNYLSEYSTENAQMKHQATLSVPQPKKQD